MSADVDKIVKEAVIINRVFDILCSERRFDTAEVLEQCCTWSEANSLRKVKYWLSYGLKNGGNYNDVRMIREYLSVTAPEGRVSIKDLAYAFKLIVKAEKNGKMVI